jgi:uncharacterized protein
MQIQLRTPKMGSKELQTGRCFVVRAKHDADIIIYLTGFAKENNISTAAFTALGALKNVKLGYYDQKKRVYGTLVFSGPIELVICVGNISLKDGEPFVHAHAVLSDDEGNVKGGHLLGGAIFAAEVHVTELLGGTLVRQLDNVTGLSLWEL